MMNAECSWKLAGFHDELGCEFRGRLGVCLEEVGLIKKEYEKDGGGVA